MTNAVIVSTARTPLAKSWKGAFNMTHGATLGGHAVQHAVARAGIDAAEVEDVIMGCASPEGATGANIARQIALKAGLPISVSGMTVNRFCSSGLQTIALAAQRIIAGEGQVYVAGGVESMTRAPFVMGKASEAFSRQAEIFDTTIGWRFVNPLMKALYGVDSMPETAENVARDFQISRADQDLFAYRSQQRAKAAQEAGFFEAEITPVEIKGRKGAVTLWR